MPFDTQIFRFADADPDISLEARLESLASWRSRPAGGGVNVDTSDLAGQGAHSPMRAHSLTCCPCGADHSAELLAHKFALAAGQPAILGLGGGLAGPDFAPDGSPQRQTFTITGEIEGSTATTVTIAPGDIVISQIETSGDKDWIRINLTAGVTYQFSLDGSGATPLADPFLEIYNASGTKLKDDDDSGPGLNALLRFTPTTSGTYYINAQGWADSQGATSTGTYTLTTSIAPALPTYSVQQIANYLINEGVSAGRRWQSTSLTYNIESLTAEQQVLAERALQMWSAVTPLTFTRVFGGANITFRNTNPTDPNATSAYAQNSYSGGFITASTIVITSNWNSGNVAFDSYTQQTYIHEVGHALGLGHAGPYNGAAVWGTDNIYTNDNWAMTVMSYFDQLESGHGSYRFVLGLQQADIAAIQQLYGTRPGGTNIGNTTYGFNSSAPGTNIDWSQFVLVQAEGTYRRPPSMTIYDTSGIDTINLSGFSQPQILDLRPGTFSTLGDRPVPAQPHYSNVVAIDASTIIENAVGGSGNDRITGNAANNVVTLGAGADTFVYALGGGADTLTDFSVAADRVELNGISVAQFDAAFAARTAEGGGTRITFAAGQSILFQGVSTSQLQSSNFVLTGLTENVINGTGSGETLTGTSGVDIINALGGNDALFGLAGNDRLFGGDGDDTLTGGAGADLLDGGDGNDWLYADVSDTFVGGAGYDTVQIEDVSGPGLTLNLLSSGIERVYATNSADNLDGSGTSVGIVLYGFGGADTLLGGSGTDYLYAGYEAVQSGLVRGGAGYDYLIHDSTSSYTGTLTINMAVLQVEGVFGSARAEIINAAGLSTFATIYTGGGADIVTGSSFNDVIFMDNAASVNAGAGFDYVVYYRFDGSGANFNLAAMNAEGGIGRDGNDILDASGVTGSFVTLYGGGGADTLRGGSGNDYLYIDAADISGGLVNGGAGYDYLINQGGTALSIVLANHAAEGFFGAGVAETISAAGLSAFATIYSGGGADTITGSGFNDVIFITNAVASINAGAGYDYVVYELFDGTGAANWNLAAMGAEGAIGRGGNDTFNASGVTTFATLYGDGGNDTLIGGAFNDTLYGGTGNDTLTGNGGADLFVFETNWGADTVTDFTLGTDRLFMRASGLSQFSQLTITQSGADALISFAGQTIRLTGITAASLNASHFEFAAAAEDPSDDKDVPVFTPAGDTFDFTGLGTLTADTPEPDIAGLAGVTPALTLDLDGLMPPASDILWIDGVATLPPDTGWA